MHIILDHFWTIVPICKFYLWRHDKNLLFQNINIFLKILQLGDDDFWFCFVAIINDIVIFINSASYPFRTNIAVLFIVGDYVDLFIIYYSNICIIIEISGKLRLCKRMQIAFLIPRSEMDKWKIFFLHFSTTF